MTLCAVVDQVNESLQRRRRAFSEERYCQAPWPWLPCPWWPSWSGNSRAFRPWPHQRPRGRAR